VDVEVVANAFDAVKAEDHDNIGEEADVIYESDMVPLLRGTEPSK